MEIKVKDKTWKVLKEVAGENLDATLLEMAEVYTKLSYLLSGIRELGINVKSPSELLDLLVELMFFEIGDDLKVQEELKERIKRLTGEKNLDDAIKRIFVLSERDYFLITELAKKRGKPFKETVIEILAKGIVQVAGEE